MDKLCGPMEGGMLAILSDATACVGPLHSGHGAGRSNDVVKRIYTKLAALRILRGFLAAQGAQRPGRRWEQAG